MVKYTVSSYQSSRNRLKIEVILPCPSEETQLFLSAWRPGRYEEGNFTRLVTHLQVFDPKGQKLSVKKAAKNAWVVETQEAEFMQVSYLYVGNILNAGNTFHDDTLLMLNPVNSLIYSDIHYSQGIQLTLNFSSPCYGKTPDASKEWTFAHYDALFDQPLLCANDVQTLTYSVNEIPFYVHQWKMPWIPAERIVQDFKAFTERQFLDFGEFPAHEFHFILLGTPYEFLHGVEHVTSTVIVIGPNAENTEEFYQRLLSVASHELYHVWNVKTLRPKDLTPYQYQTLNYSRLGYIYEGVTTYMGDIYLLEAGIINGPAYLEILTKLMQTHLDNPGRFSMSVADSSVDTWVDGYVKGTPGRKVSIYNEGALIAFMLDIQLRKATNHKVRLSSFMQQLYLQFGKSSEGYTETAILEVLHSLSSVDFTPFFQRYVNGANGYESGLVEALEFLGVTMELRPPKFPFTGTTGIRLGKRHGSYFIAALAEGGPGETAGLCEEDELISLNGIAFQEENEAFIMQLEGIAEIQLEFRRRGIEKTVILPSVQRTFFPTVVLTKGATEEKQVLKNQELFGI